MVREVGGEAGHGRFPLVGMVHGSAREQGSAVLPSARAIRI